MAGNGKLSSLENRLSKLEALIIGDQDTTENYSSIDGTLLNIHSLLNTALSGRDPINKAMTRLDELDKYLDPCFENSGLNTLAKLQRSLVMETDVKKTAQLAEQLEALEPVLNSARIKEVPNLEKRLDSLILLELQKKETLDELSEKINHLINDYNTVVANISGTFVQWNNIITYYETSGKPKETNDV